MTPDVDPAPAGRLSARAVERALDARTRDAAAEVDRILAAAFDVIQRAEPESPRVADIIAAAGSSNQAFYRYFTGKDDVILAVMERGVAILCSYLEHQMAKEPAPELRVARWIAGVLAQNDDPELTQASRAVGRQVDAIRPRRPADTAGFRDQLVDLLMPSLQEAAARNPFISAHAIYDVAFGALSRHVHDLTPVPLEDREAILRLCLDAAALPVPTDLRRFYRPVRPVRPVPTD